MIGLSCYILADTLFVSKSLGSNGVGTLNFSLSVYSILNGIGLIIEVFNSQNDPDLTSLASKVLKLYFIDFFFAGINIIT